MLVKKAVSLLSGLGETTLSCGMNTCKKAINKIGKFMVYKNAGERFEKILKSALKLHEILKNENIMKLKEKLLLTNGMEKNSESVCCPNCGLTLPSYYIFCLYCGTQLFDDILCSSSKKSPKILSKTLKNFLDFSFFLDNIKLLVFLLQELKTCRNPLTRCNYRL